MAEMSSELRVHDVEQAQDIASRLARAMGKYPSLRAFHSIKLDIQTNIWHVECDYYDEKLIFKIDAKTGSVLEYSKR